MFDVALTNPVVGLLPDANRVSVRLDARLASPFIAQPVNGVFTLSSQLEYDAASHSVVLRSPGVDSVSVSGGAESYTQQINAAAALLATQLLTNYPVYTFKPEQLQFAGVTYEPVQSPSLQTAYACRSSKSDACAAGGAAPYGCASGPDANEHHQR